VVDRIERLDSGWIHGMHGGSLRRESIPNFVRALREKPFAHEGSCSGASSRSRPKRSNPDRLGQRR
jgi:hypothetical protein